MTTSPCSVSGYACLTTLVTASLTQSLTALTCLSEKPKSRATVSATSRKGRTQSSSRTSAVACKVVAKENLGPLLSPFQQSRTTRPPARVRKRLPEALAHAPFVLAGRGFDLAVC